MKKKLFVLIILALLTIHVEVIAGEKVGALGRITPAGGIVNLTGPSGDTIAAIMVSPGDFVKKGTPLVMFHSKFIYELEVALAESALREADQLGKKAIIIQELNVKAAEEDYNVAVKRLSRFEKVDGETLSVQQMELRKRQAIISKINLDLATQELQRLELRHEINVTKAQKELGVAREKLKNATIRAPRDGTVIEVLRNVGEGTGGGSIIRMAELRQMYVTAEIFESDLLKLSPGQKATITSNSLPETLSGNIESVGRVISEESKVAKVVIRLERSDVAARLINMEVNVSINF